MSEGIPSSFDSGDAAGITLDLLLVNTRLICLQDLAGVVSTPAARVIYQHFHPPLSDAQQDSITGAHVTEAHVPKLKLAAVNTHTDLLQEEGYILSFELNPDPVLGGTVNRGGKEMRTSTVPNKVHIVHTMAQRA